MSSCLGLYIEDHIIKYAKVSKEREQLKVETFGTKIYDNLEETIKKIVEETYSFKTPISINLSEELYNYFNMFALLSKADLSKAIKTEFEAFCSEKNYNPNVFEQRYAITPNVNDKEKLKVIHISENKIELNKKIQTFSQYSLENISPVSMTIPNITEFEPKENVLIVNIEEKTIITTVLDQKIYEVKKFDIGSQDFLDKINLKENSYSKAYEICKETTIYTSEGKDLTDVDANYLEDIMPTLYEIVGQVRKIINESIDKIDKVYITGTASLINNIDLYFEEYLENIKCEILKPSFIKISPEINIKDYVEVNSAISLALSGLGQGISGMNFKKTSFLEKLQNAMKIEIKPSKKSGGNKFKSKFINMDLNVPLDKQEKRLIRLAGGLLIIFIVYSSFSTLLVKQIDKKTIEAENVVNETAKQISNVQHDNDELIKIKSNYTDKINALEQLTNSGYSSDGVTKKQMPNLLNSLMYIMPDEVQITSIQTSKTMNKQGRMVTHVEIQAKSNKYEQLGYLTANIQAKNILNDVISTAGQKDNNIVTVKIEGDLP